MKISILYILSGLLLLSSAKDFKGAEYRTKTSYLYGRFEVNYKAPQRDGVLASFFTFYDGGGGVSTWNEIDIEIMGRYYDDVQFNTITPGEQHHVRHQGVDFNPAASFNTYAFEWTPDYVAWFINDQEVYRQTGSHIQTLNRAQKIMMNTWIPQYENWAGIFNADALPAFAYYDWVKYYSYTPGSGTYGTNNNFSLQWVDNLDFFNSDRWAKATHTFNGNLCDFIPENIVFRQGKMILCLTDAVNTGLSDLKVPVLLYARAGTNKIIVHFTEELDSLSSQTAANYILPGYTVESASLLENEKSVRLSVPGLNLVQPTNLLVLNVKDKAGNKMISKAVSALPQPQWQYPLRINVGSTSPYLDFLPDREFKPDADYGYQDGTSGTYGTVEISGTEDDPVYRSDRYGLAKYMVRLPEGSYNIELWFTENYFGSAGQRIFDIFIEGVKVKENFDIFASSGFRNAYNLSFNNILANDGILDIHFSAEINNPLLNGIVISPVTSSVNETENPHNFSLYQNYPNPFNSLTSIKFNAGDETEAELEIYNLLGQKLYNEKFFNLLPGVNEITYNAASLTSGVYIYVLKGNKNRATNKMVLLK